MITVIYHSADFDGIFCREIARHFLGELDVQYIGWNFGDPLIPFPDDGTVYVLDLSPDCFTVTSDNLPTRANGGFDGNFNRLVWIDHHKTSIEKWPTYIPGYRIDGVAACRLAWQWFNAPRNSPMPTIQDYKQRMVNEPLAVRLAGEYDIWDKRDPRAEVFQFGLRSRELNAECWQRLLAAGGIVFELLRDGEVLQRYAQKQDADLVNYKSWLMDWEGLKFLCLNTGRFNSLAFAAKDVVETGHDALMGFAFNGKLWTVSLYHANHRKDLDLSEIAKRHGGGGHRGACGFTCKLLPFSFS